MPLTRDQAHYLGNVMRMGPGDALVAFDGRNGAWSARIAELSKRGGAVEAMERVAVQRDPPDLWLLFAPIRKARTDFVVEKAAELGAARIVPVQTRRTNADRIRRDRLQAHAVEAAEQCGGTFVPEVADLTPLDRLLDRWPEGRALVFADETLSDDPAWARDGELGAMPPAPAAILIGPEGGFADEERTRIRAIPQAVPVRLGPRILRADTAAVAALTLWQARRGRLAMIRPEVLKALLRWREALVGSALLALGLWLAAGFGLPRLFGVAAISLGAVLIASGLRRALLRPGAEAPGILEVDEGRITYLAPLMGGSVALDELSEVAHRRTGGGEAFWRLAPVDGAPLIVPTGARGCDALLDALAPLPGFDGGALVRASRRRARGTIIVWRRVPRSALTRT